jgi:hypothetical protein
VEVVDSAKTYTGGQGKEMGGLSQEIRNVLYDAGLVARRGKIIE